MKIKLIIAIIIVFVFIFLGLIYYKDNQSYFSMEKRINSLGHTVCEFSQDHAGKLPHASTWCDDLMEYQPMLAKYYFKKQVLKDFPCGFAFNKNISGMHFDTVPENTPILFEARNGAWNLNGAAELIEDDRPVYAVLRYGSVVYAVKMCPKENRFEYIINEKVENRINWDPGMKNGEAGADGDLLPAPSPLITNTIRQAMSCAR